MSENAAEDMDVDQETSVPAPAPVNDEQPTEEKEEELMTTVPALPMEATLDVQAAMGFVTANLAQFQSDVSTATRRADEIVEIHNQKQRQLFEEFAAQSMALMEGYNAEIGPLREQIGSSKEPLSAVFQNKHISIPCTYLQSRSQGKTGGVGTAPLGGPNYGGGPPIPSYSAYSNTSGRGTGGAWGETQWTYNRSTQGAFSKQNRFKPLDVSGNPKEVVMKLFREMKDAEARKRQDEERKVREVEMKRQREEQRLQGAQQLLNVIPWLTIEQSTAVMEMKDDNIDQATNWLLSGDPSDAIMVISTHIQTKNAANVMIAGLNAAASSNDDDGGATAEDSGLYSTFMSAVNTTLATITGGGGGDGDVDMGGMGMGMGGGMDDTRHFLQPGVLNRSQTDGNEKRVTFVVIDVSDDGRIVMRGVLDRNDIPLDSSQARILTLTFEELLQSRMLFVEDERVQTLRISNVLKIVYRKDETTNDYTPLSLEPIVRVQEYNFQFGSADISRVTHRTDGSVLYRGILDSGSTGLFNLNQPIELYSQVLDEVTHNILSIVVHDLSEDITVDVFNITNTPSTVEEYKSNFSKDAMGRALGYRIIVNNQRVAAILSPVGDSVRELPFIEHIVPLEESLVKLPNGKAGILKNIPTGLIVTNDPDRANAISSNSKTILFPRAGDMAFHNSGRHVADLDGLVDVEVIRVGGNWMFQEPLYEAHMVSTIEPGDMDLQMEYLNMKEAMSTNKTDSFVEKLAMIESVLNCIRSRSPGPNGETPAELLSKAQSDVNEAKQTLSSENLQADPQLVEGWSRQLTNFERELRALRFEVRNMM